jgi:hypothetical protein
MLQKYFHVRYRLYTKYIFVMTCEVQYAVSYKQISFATSSGVSLPLVATEREHGSP